MRQRRIEDWSRGSSQLHRLHPTVKIAVILTFLIAVSTMRGAVSWFSAVACVLVLAGAMTAHVPLRAFFTRAAAVLPFALCFAILSLVSGEVNGAAMMVLKSYLSASAALLLVATTPMPRLIEGLELLRLPRFLLQVMQFLYRYLSVLMDEAEAMRIAAQSRAGNLLKPEFRRVAAIAGVLFARAWSRAEAVHRAMVARGFAGRLPANRSAAFRPLDAALAVLICAAIAGIRVALP